MSSIAIIGASTDRKKYGNKAVRAYLAGGWTVYPIHPSAAEIEGVAAFASILDVPKNPDRVALYVPPQTGMKLLSDIADKQPGELYLNPGSESPELVTAAQGLGLRPIQACSIVNLGLRPDMFPDE